MLRIHPLNLPLLPVAAKMWTDPIQKRRELNLFPVLVCIRTSGVGRLVCLYPRINNGYEHTKIRLLTNEFGGGGGGGGEEEEDG